MGKRMTVVFHDDDLYTELKIKAVRENRPASEIVAEAVREWLERREDARLLPRVAEARAEWQEKGGRAWSEVEQEVGKSVTRRTKRSRSSRVQG